MLSQHMRERINDRGIQVICRFSFDNRRGIMSFLRLDKDFSAAMNFYEAVSISKVLHAIH